MIGMTIGGPAPTMMAEVEWSSPITKEEGKSILAVGDGLDFSVEGTLICTFRITSIFSKKDEHEEAIDAQV